MLSQEQLDQNHELTLQLFDFFKQICDENHIKYYVAEGTAIGTVREKGFIPWDTNMDISLLPADYEKLDSILSSAVPDNMLWENPDYGRRLIKWLVHKDPAKSTQLKPIPNIDVSIFAPTSNFLVIRYLHLTILHYGYEAFRLKNSPVKRTYPYNVLKFFASLIPNGLYRAVHQHYLHRYKPEKARYLINMAPGGHFHKGDLVEKAWIDGPEEVWGEFEGRRVRLPSEYHTYLTRYYGDYMTPKTANKGKMHHVKE